MVIQVELIRKQVVFPTESCRVDQMVELVQKEYAEFVSAPMGSYAFIQAFNRKRQEEKDGVRSCLLVLGEGEKDGILVDTQGYGYARYTAYVPNARQMVLLDRYPQLASVSEEMARLADLFVKKAIEGQRDGKYRIFMEEAKRRCQVEYFQGELLAAMLSERPEIGWADPDGDGIAVEIAPAYVLQERKGALQRLTQEEADIMCAKHTLWFHEAGGAQADFTGCLVEGLNLSHRELISAIFQGTKFVGANLNNADLSCCWCQGAEFIDCECSEMMAHGSEFQDAEFRSTALSYSVYVESNLSRVRFLDSPLDGCLMQNCCIDGTDFGQEEQRASVFTDCCTEEEAWRAEQNGQSLGS